MSQMIEPLLQFRFRPVSEMGLRGDVATASSMNPFVMNDILRWCRDPRKKLTITPKTDFVFSRFSYSSECHRPPRPRFELCTCELMSCRNGLLVSLPVSLLLARSGFVLHLGVEPNSAGSSSV